MYKNLRIKILQLILLLILSVAADQVLARAGGGGGRGYSSSRSSYGGGGRSSYGYNSYGRSSSDSVDVFMIIVLIGLVLLAFSFFGLVSANLLKGLIMEKRDTAHKQLQSSEAEDPVWNKRLLHARIEEVFFKVQFAWTDRNQEAARKHMSSRIYQKHKLQTDAMLQANRRNVLEDINLKEIIIIGAEDYLDNSIDAFAAFLKGTIIDYHVDELTGFRIQGNEVPEDFAEIWRFIRDDNTWVLDEIDQEVTYDDVLQTITKKEQPVTATLSS